MYQLAANGSVGNHLALRDHVLNDLLIGSHAAHQINTFQDDGLRFVRCVIAIVETAVGADMHDGVCAWLLEVQIAIQIATHTLADFALQQIAQIKFVTASHRIEISDGIDITLYKGWKDHPIFGTILIVTPYGDTLKDWPESDNHFGPKLKGIESGLYKILPYPKGSRRKVELYNYWEIPKN